MGAIYSGFQESCGLRKHTFFEKGNLCLCARFMWP